MKKQRLALGAALALMLAGCGKKSPCPEGSYSNPTHKFCLKLPSGVAFDKEEDRSSFKILQFGKSGAPGRMSVNVYKNPSESFPSQKAFIESGAQRAASKGDTVVASGKSEGAEEGSFLLIKFKSGSTHQLNYVIKDGNQMVECYANTGPEDIDAILASCKTLRNLKP
jgi:hypothetical protein